MHKDTPRVNLVFHDLQHTVNRWLVELGVSEIIIQPILGHAKSPMTAHYAHIDILTRLRALNRLCEPALISDNVARFTSPLISPLSAEKY